MAQSPHDPWQPLADLAPLALEPARYAALVAASADPPRAYHSFGHVLDVAARWRDVDVRLGWTRRRETFAAVLYHDAIYFAGRSDNEERSAALARSELAGRGDLDLAEVERLILLTARHGRIDAHEIDRDAALFLDCHMAILGETPERFAAYDRAIRSEYAAVPDDLYRVGRRRFLKRLLASPRIFLSEDFRERLEGRARGNVAKRLSGGEHS